MRPRSDTRAPDRRPAAACRRAALRRQHRYEPIHEPGDTVTRPIRVLLAGGTIGMVGTPASPSPAALRALLADIPAALKLDGIEVFSTDPSVHRSGEELLELVHRAAGVATE